MKECLIVTVQKKDLSKKDPSVFFSSEKVANFVKAELKDEQVKTILISKGESI